MNILLLGGTGYLGGNIASSLVKEGHHIICTVRSTSDISRLKKLDVSLISNEPGQIELTFKNERIDWVINGVCAYRPDDSLYGNMFESNVSFPLCTLNYAVKYGVENYMTMGTGLPEDFSVYSFTKGKFSEFGRFLSYKAGINFLDLKLEMFYGGSDEPDTRFLKSCRLRLKNEECIKLTEGNQKRDIIRVEDIVKIIGILMKKNCYKGYQALPVGTGEQHSVREIVTFMKDVMGSGSELDFGAVPYREDEPDTLADISWMKTIGYEVSESYFEGLRKECEGARRSIYRS